ncbi:MAG: NAD(P)/FAD-dependent oxidoreductase [Deltaproteobacteria bacterium]|nr:NAD(P)/FAD-dependent oxidoreductase [Deltaproteobacteria bacterium]
MDPRNIAVIAGAGPAGLTAAWELLKRTDIVPIVVEPAALVGGIASTHEHHGNRIDLGGHRFFSRAQRVMDWWFNILPLQGAPSSDTLARGHAIDYARQATQDFLRPELCPPRWRDALVGTRLVRPAPDPEQEEEVMLQRPRLSRIFHRRRFFPYPLSITPRVMADLGWTNMARIGASYLHARVAPLPDETYLEAFFINRFGRRLYETFFRDYTEKVWGVPCRDIRADWGAQRVRGLSLTRALTTAARDLLRTDAQRAHEERETTLITRFYYPKRGPGQMWTTVADQVRGAGGTLLHGARVTGVRTEAGRVVAVTVRHDDGRAEDIRCGHFFSTMPLRELLAGLEPTPPPDVARIAAGLVYRDFLTVGVLLRRLHVRQPRGAPLESVPDNWIYVQEGDVQMGRIQVFNNWSPYLVADPRTTTWLGLEYFVNDTDALWRQSDSATMALGIGELERMGFARAEDVLDACVLRVPKAYPAYWGTYPELPRLQQYLDGIGNLYAVGRNGMHRYNNQDHSMLTAMTAVDNIVRGARSNANLWDINLEMAYHEEK